MTLGQSYPCLVSEQTVQATLSWTRFVPRRTSYQEVIFKKERNDLEL